MLRRLLAASLLAGCRPPEPARPSVAPDPQAVLEDRCEAGDGAACVEVAAIERDRGDLARALVHARRACDLASARGCAELAGALERGEGAAPAPERALDLYVSACLGGHLAACHAAADRLPAPRGDEFRRRACARPGPPELAARCPAPVVEVAAPGVDPRDAANVIRALAALRGELRACYEAGLRRRPGLRGVLVVEVAIDGAGLARAAAVREGLPGARQVGECVATLALRAGYAPTVSGEVVVVPYRVVFAPAE